jgi:hypothetical protein
LLKGRTVEPEKQLLPANGCESTFVSRKWLGKHIPAARIPMQQQRYCWKRGFLFGPWKGDIRKIIGATESVLYERL